MKLNDVADQLRVLLPRYTSLLSEYLSITSVTAVGGVATIVTSAPHGLTTGRFVILNGVGRQTPISATSVPAALRVGFETSIDHDVTMNWFADPEDASTDGRVRLGGFTTAQWNGLHELSSVPNRRNFQVKTALTAPVLNGAEYILEVEAGGMIGAYPIISINSTNFSIAGGFPDGDYLGGTISKMPRISVAITGVDAWTRLITPQTDDAISIVVIPLPVRTSKDRREYSDAVAAQTKGQDVRLKLIDGFTIAIVVPTHKQLSAGRAIDLCRHDLRGPLYRCLYGAIFPTGTSLAGDYKAIPISDEVLNYDHSILVYGYDFQIPYDIATGDAVSPKRTTAFRDILYTLDEGDGMTNTVDLDDEPLTS